MKGYELKTPTDRNSNKEHSLKIRNTSQYQRLYSCIYFGLTAGNYIIKRDRIKAILLNTQQFLEVSNLNFTKTSFLNPYLFLTKLDTNNKLKF